MKNRTCQDCVYFYEFEYECRKNPPVYVNQSFANFPKVRDTYWCGEFIKNESLEGKKAPTHGESLDDHPPSHDS